MSPGWTGSRGYADWNIKQGQPLPGLGFRYDSDQATQECGGFRLGSG